MLDDKSQVSRGVVVDIPLGWESPSVRRESEITKIAEMQVAHRAKSWMENESRIIINLSNITDSRGFGGRSEEQHEALFKVY
jgi:hypothetical protein